MSYNLKLCLNLSTHKSDQVMLEDIRAAAAAGAHGVVAGCLTAEGDVHTQQTAALLAEARRLGELHLWHLGL